VTHIQKFAQNCRTLLCNRFHKAVYTVGLPVGGFYCYLLW